MVDVLAKITLPSVTGVDRDSVVNTLAYRGAEIPVAASFDALRDNISDFFNTEPPSSTGFGDIADRLSGVLSRAAGACTIDLYEIPATPGLFGSPIASRSFTLGAANAGIGMPSEVAVALSFNADLTDVLEKSGNTRPAARRRGRIFLGPVNADAVSLTDQSGPQRVRGQLQTIIRHSAKDRLRDAADVDGWEWMVFSRTDWVMRPVVRVSTDDALDTIRSRGEAATVRTFLAI